MTAEQLKDDITKQINLGFHTNEIRKNMFEKGIDIKTIDATLQELLNEQKDLKGDSKVRLYSVLLIVLGIIYLVTLRPVFGSLSFNIKSSGDLVRLRELFVQPIGGLFLIVFSIILFIRKRRFQSSVLKAILIIWFVFLAFLSVFSNNFLNLLVGISVLVILNIVVKKNS